MANVEAFADKIRSKNAGPFWLTIDIFCGSVVDFEQLKSHLTDEAVAQRLDIPVGDLKRFDIEDLQVVKISLPRPTVQGAAADRDMHGAQWANAIAEMRIPDISPTSTTSSEVDR